MMTFEDQYSLLCHKKRVDHENEKSRLLQEEEKVEMFLKNDILQYKES